MMRNHGFTLLELLVVVATIAILASLACPLFAMARDAARTVACANNQRQIGLLYEAYAGDHSGTYPPAYLRNDMGWNWPERPMPYPTGSAKTKWENAARGTAMGVHGESAFGNWSAWHMYLAPYASREQRDGWGGSRNLGLERLYNCPAAPLQVEIDLSLISASAYPYVVDGRRLRTPFQETLGMSYGPNTACLGTNQSAASPSANSSSSFTVWANGTRVLPGWPGYGVGVSGLRDNARARARFPNPSGTIQIAEHWGGLPTSAQGGKFRVFWTDAPFVRPAVDGQGAPLTRPGDWSWSVNAVGVWPWTLDGFDGWALRASHRARSNYLFVDGHVESRTPWELCPGGDPATATAWTGRN